MKFAIIVNISRETALDLARKLAVWFKERGVEYIFETQSAEKLHTENSLPIEELSKHCDAFVSLGGDGTLLFTSHFAITKPIIGVNVGYLGFLTEFTQAEMFGAIEKVLNGTYSIHNRLQLEASLPVNNDRQRFKALNDVVIEKGTYPRIPTFVIKLDGELLTFTTSAGITEVYSAVAE